MMRLFCNQLIKWTTHICLGSEGITPHGLETNLTQTIDVKVHQENFHAIILLINYLLVD